MDIIRPTANQRFDLVDIQRLLTFLQEAFGYIHGAKFGDLEYYTTGAAADTEKRPLLVSGFKITKTGTPSLTVNIYREYTYSGENFQALAFDKDGYRIAGPTSPTSYPLTLTASPVVGYFICRRKATDGTNETRQYYSTALGKYTQTTDTITYDDWEVAQSDTSARSTASLRDAGWIDIGEYITNGTDDITNLDYHTVDPSTGDATRAVINKFLKWTVSPPDPDRLPANLFEVISGISQILARMRYGAFGRDWYEDPSDDACFDADGGLRLARGGVLQSVYIRNPYSNQVSIQQNTASDADDLRFFRSTAIITGDNNRAGYPDPDNTVGFLYSDDLDGASNLVTVRRYINIHGCDFLPPDNLNIHPWTLPSSGLNAWCYTGGGYVNKFSYWVYPWSTGSATNSSALKVPLNLPDKCRLYRVGIRLASTSGMHSNEELGVAIVEGQYGATVNIMNTGGTITWTNYGAGNSTHWQTVDTTTYPSIDPQNKTYYAAIFTRAIGAIPSQSYDFKIFSLRVDIDIREASWVYEY